MESEATTLPIAAGLLDADLWSLVASARLSVECRMAVW